MKIRMFDALLSIVKIEPDSIQRLGIDWEDEDNVECFLKMADLGGVSSWCYYQFINQKALVEEVPDVILRKLKGRYLTSLMANRQKALLYQQMKELLREEEMPVALLKGMALAFTVYPDEALRPMGDMDLLVPEEKVFEARDCLLKNGGKAAYIPLSHWHEAHHGHVRAIQMPADRSLIELHARLYSRGNRYQPKRFNWGENIVSRRTEMGEVLRLNDAWMVYHLATHLYFGYRMGGVRLGWLLDLAVLFEQVEDVTALMHKVFTIHPQVNNDLKQVMGWASRLMSNTVKDELKPFLPKKQDFPELEIFTQHKGNTNLHRGLMLRELLNTPGLIHKTMGAWHHLFPSYEYMQYTYGVERKIDFLKAYVNRWKGSGKKG